MAIGGDPLQTINQQQFTPDPAMDDDFFKQAVESGNLQALEQVIYLSSLVKSLVY